MCFPSVSGDHRNDIKYRDQHSKYNSTPKDVSLNVNDCSENKINTGLKNSPCTKEKADGVNDNQIVTYECCLEPSTLEHSAGTLYDIVVVQDGTTSFETGNGNCDHLTSVDLDLYDLRNSSISDLVTLPSDTPSSTTYNNAMNEITSPSGSTVDIQKPDSSSYTDYHLSSSFEDESRGSDLGYELSSNDSDSNDEHVKRNDLPLKTHKNETAVQKHAPLVPYSCSESDTEYEQHEEPKTKKRKRNVDKWKKSVRKRKCLSGQEHQSTLGKTIKKREMKPPCQPNCRLKCATNLGEEEEKYLIIFGMKIGHGN